jgi:hypothetical protein
MEDMSSSSWQRRGSSIIFHKSMLGPLIVGGHLVSLREALSWLNHWPAEPPGRGATVLVGGLEACLEVLAPDEGEQFLRTRVKPLILEFQHHWDQRGLVFGFGCSERRFRLDAQDQVNFSCSGGVVRLSESLWNGAAKDELLRLVVNDPDTMRDVPGGFHVRRLS